MILAGILAFAVVSTWMGVSYRGGVDKPCGVTRLLARWCAALPPATDPAAAGRAGRMLLRCWGQPHRHHHGMEHLVAVLDAVDANGGLATDPDVVRLAAWLHDAVYDPEAADNEERSAWLAGDVLDRLRVGSDRVAEVVRLVRLTASHRPAPGEVDGCLLVDADLGILAASPERYDEYAEHIRLECGHLGDAAFVVGRIRVLRDLVGEPLLYRVVPGREAMTLVARANLTREIGRLESAGGLAP